LGILTLLNNLDTLFDGDPNTSIVDAILDDFFPSRNPATPIANQVAESLVNDQAFVDDLVTATQGATVVAPQTIDELTDVDTSSSTSGDVLSFDGTNWVPVSQDEDEPAIISGCMDATATNYNADATVDDGSCVYDSGDPNNPLYFGGNCSDPQYTNKCACETALETWTGDTTASSTTTFAGAGVFNTPISSSLTRVGQLPLVHSVDVPSTGSYFMTFANTSLYAPITLGMGNIELKRSDGTLHMSIPASSCIIHNNVLEIPFSNRDRTTDYYILMDEGVVEYCGVLSPAITQASETIHTTEGKFQDITPYAIPSNSLSTPPVDIAISTYTTANTLQIDQFTVEFNQQLQPGTGNIGIYEIIGGINQGVVVEFPISSCRIENDTVISPLFTPLALDSTYCILIDAGFVTQDNTATGNCGITPVPFIGESDITAMPITSGNSFTLTKIDYINDAEDDNVEVPVRTNFAMEFSREIYLNCGAVRIYTSDGTLVQELNINTSFQEAGTYGIISKTSSNTITVNPTKYFEFNGDYYIQADAELVRDGNFNYWGGISDTSWAFTTIKGPTIVSSTDLADEGKTGFAIEYDRPLTEGTGSAMVYASDGTLIDTIPVTDSKITIEN